jgi:homocysteine S-methyltransferase
VASRLRSSILEGLELPDFAAFHLLKRPEGEAALRKYFQTYAALAERFGTGLIFEGATWRASADWGARLGYTEGALADANQQAIRLLEEIREEPRTCSKPVVISGCVGPRGDGYIPGDAYRRSAGIPPPSDRNVRCNRRRHGDGDHHELR